MEEATATRRRAARGRSAGPGYEQLELGRQLCFALYSASRAVMRAYGPLLEELGLTYPQYVTMLALWEQPDRPITVGALGDLLDLDSGTLTPLLKRLEGAGLVRRSRDPADERRVMVQLTPAGLALRERAVAVPAEMARRFGLPERQLTTLREQLDRLMDAMQP